LGNAYIPVMQVVALRTLRLFWQRHPQAETPLRTWYSAVSQAEWAGPADVRAQFGSADFVADNRVIFDIGGNKFRLVAHVSYEFKAVLVKFVGTHAEYNEIDPATCGLT
jgi:mRNA interferase HigB